MARDEIETSPNYRAPFQGSVVTSSGLLAVSYILEAGGGLGQDLVTIRIAAWFLARRCSSLYRKRLTFVLDIYTHLVSHFLKFIFCVPVLLFDYSRSVLVYSELGNSGQQEDT